MSILIKGMEMPKEGTVFVIDSAGQVWSNEWPTRGYIRLDGVTAVPVPKHGRLIDADAFIRNIAKLERVDPITAAGVIAFVNAAPTIIEAEVGER